MLLITDAGRHPETGQGGYLSYVQPDASLPLFYTGPKAIGNFILKDGTAYNVADHAIEVASLDHAYELDHHLAVWFEGNGLLDGLEHPVTGEAGKFVHAACAFCPPSRGYKKQKALLFSNTGYNAALHGGLDSVIPFISLHTATPGQTGASEYAGVTRQSATFAAPSSGSMATSNTQTFTTSGATPVTYIGGWSLVSSGTYAGGAALTASVQAASIVFATGAISFGATG